MAAKTLMYINIIQLEMKTNAADKIKQRTQQFIK